MSAHESMEHAEHAEHASGENKKIALLIAVLVQGNAPAAVTTAFALLVVAALGGFFLASFHLRGRLPPVAVVVIHAGVAAAGVLALLSAVL